MIWGALLLSSLIIASFLLALAEANWRFEGDHEVLTDVVSLVRIVLLAGVVAILSGWLAPVIAAVLTMLVFAAQQVLGQRFAESGFSVKVARFCLPTATALQPVFGWLRIHKPEPTPELEQELIESVEEFSDTVVREVMVPRVDLEAVSADETLEEALSVFVSSGYSRLPVFEKNIDDIVGVLYLKDIARVTHQNPDRLSSERVREVARKAIFVPETKPVADLLREMQRSATQIAIVSDEYGGIAGIATVEDLIEEIVGDISDEYDRELPEIELLEEGLFRISPRANIFEFAENFELEIEDQEVDTVGGLLSKLLGSLPRAGDRVEFEGVELVAERVDAKRQRLQSVLARKIATEQPND